MGRDPGLGRKSWKDRIAFLCGRRKERREDSDDPGVRGHKESPKDSPICFLWERHTGWSAAPRSEPETTWEEIERWLRVPEPAWESME
jgi:hypothetical protein